MKRPHLHWPRAAFGGLGLAAVALVIASPGRSEQATAASAPAPAPAAVSPGEGLYVRKCGFCHVGRNTGTIMLERRLGAGQGELARRTDLEADYVVGVARAGLMSMPPISRVDATDEELGQIAAYLARSDKAQAAPR